MFTNRLTFSFWWRYYLYERKQQTTTNKQNFIRKQIKTKKIKFAKELLK